MNQVKQQYLSSEETFNIALQHKQQMITEMQRKITSLEALTSLKVDVQMIKEVQGGM